MMIATILSKILDLKELEELSTVRRNINKAIRKHSRKLIRVKLYLNWEIKYETKTVAKWILRTVTLRLWGRHSNLNNLWDSYTRLRQLCSHLSEWVNEWGSEWVK